MNELYALWEQAVMNGNMYLANMVAEEIRWLDARKDEE